MHEAFLLVPLDRHISIWFCSHLKKKNPDFKNNLNHNCYVTPALLYVNSDNGKAQGIKHCNSRGLWYCTLTYKIWVQFRALPQISYVALGKSLNLFLITSSVRIIMLSYLTGVLWGEIPYYCEVLRCNSDVLSGYISLPFLNYLRSLMVATIVALIAMTRPRFP